MTGFSSSIIVGDMVISAALGPRGPLGMPFNCARRSAATRRCSERFQARGVFDPDPDRMAEAIQTELQRAAQAVAAALTGAGGRARPARSNAGEQAAGDKVATDPEPQLFRAIARGGDLRCAAVAAPVAVVTPRVPKPGRDPAKPRQAQRRRRQAHAAGQARPARETHRGDTAIQSFADRLGDVPLSR